MPADWREEVLACNPLPVLLELLDEVASAQAVCVCSRPATGEIGLGPAPDAGAAVFVSERGISLCLGVEEGALLAAIGDLEVLGRDDPGMRQVDVPNDRLLELEAREELPRFLLSAFARSLEEVSNP
jgi:hypothetical protein